MKKRILFSATILMLALSACKNNQKKTDADTTQETISITHELGTVKIIKNPKKIVALDYASLENLKELGKSVVGIPKSHVPQYLSDYKNDEKVADLGTMFEVDYEELSALEPDVVFISARMRANYEELSKIAPTVFLQTDTNNNLESLKKNLLVFGEIFDKKEAANTIMTNLQKRVDTLYKKVNNTDKTALMIMHNNGKFSAFGKDSRFGVIYKLFGFKEAVNNIDAARHGQAISNEFIQKANPDYLFILDRSAVVNKQATNKEEIENKLVQNTKAYQNKKVIYLDPEAWYISGDGVTSFNKKIEAIEDNL
ncbi:siderophore ABC transporter substrate-binding protein [Polaribacter sargassicola]|uniref:siderophore ABC transporter substrate-binding protein n=1 Tax=Polaribacter sargassicola TaxID=2836891 RepID=UPI001F2F385B|nr:siderophore ABC transporter substrate-binding protein [Polaribacter sp. DS7-9]MCG1035311.1 siderophore ABC transporter substrate-binding protein [Polaribacter sp. DS7-9]